MKDQSVPDEWKSVHLSEVATLIMGQSPPGSTYNQKSEGMPFLQGKAEFTDLYPEHVKYTSDPKKIAPQGSVLMSVRAPVGDVNIAPIDYCIGRGLASISLDEGDNRFLFHLLQFLKDDIAKEGTGSTFKAINKSSLQSVRIQYPPLPEQKRIAYILSAVQEAKEKTEAVIEATKQLKKSLMKYLFTYGPVPVEEAEKVKLKETEIGMIPEDWEIISIGDICKIRSGGTPSRKNPEYWNGNIPWVKTTEINYGTIYERSETITQLGLENSSAIIVPKGSLLMAMYGQGVTRGRVAILGIDASVNQACAVISPIKKISVPFLYYYFTLHYERVRDFGHGAHQKNLSATLLKQVKVSIPPLGLQDKISKVLNAVDSKLQAEARTLNALEILFKALLNNLMTGKVRTYNLELGT